MTLCSILNHDKELVKEALKLEKKAKKEEKDYAVKLLEDAKKLYEEADRHDLAERCVKKINNYIK